MKLHSTQRVLCVCRGGQVRSVATRFILSETFGFRRVICCGWEKNDEQTLNELCDWADVVLVVGRPSDWGINTPTHKTIHIEIGRDDYGHYQHPRLLELLMPKICALVEPKPAELIEVEQYKEYIPDGYFFKDDLDGGRLVKKES